MEDAGREERENTEPESVGEIIIAVWVMIADMTMRDEKKAFKELLCMGMVNVGRKSADEQLKH